MRRAGTDVPGRAAAAGAALAAAVALGAGACAEDGVHEGRFRSSFETSAFFPCGADETWWVRADSADWDRLHAPPARLDTAGGAGPESTAFVRVRGQVSDSGEYGHMGAYDREITVSEVVEVSAPDEEGCP